MFSHIMVGANDIEQSKKFYDALMGVLGGGEGILSMNPTGQKRYIYLLDDMTFLITEPIDGKEATHGNGTTIGFSVKDPETGDRWHQAGLANGGTSCEDPPGTREFMGMKLYLAYLKDPSGNKICTFLNQTE